MPLTRRAIITAAAALSAPAALRAAGADTERAAPADAARTEPGSIAPAAAPSNVVVRRTYVDGPWGQVHMRIAQPARRRDDVKPALVCFHYSPGSARMFDDVLPLLATDRTVIAPDTPGYGASAPPPAQPTLPEYANALASALANLGHGERGRPIDLLGHLTGSLLALELATTRPRWIRRVVLSRSPAFDAERRRTYVADILARVETRKQDPHAAYLVERLKRGLDGRPPGTPPSLYLGQFIDSISPGDTWAWGDIAAISYPAEDRFPSLAQPTLLLKYPNSEEDAWRRTPSLLPRARVVELTGAADWAWQLDPQRIVTPVREFLG